MKRAFVILTFLIATGCNKSDNKEKNRVYVCGQDYDSQYGSLNKAKYWINGQAVYLPDGGNMAHINISGMAVSGSDVYMTGISGNPAAYWKNDQLVTVGDGVHDIILSGVAVSGNDVYVAGNADFQPQAFYWKNGQIVTLEDSSYVRSIVVSGADVYMAGNIGHRGVYWKNGQAVILTNGNSYTSITGIAISGNDTYVAGSEADNAGHYITKYWKNGQPEIPDIGDSKYMQDNYPVYIAVSGNDVYIATTESIPATTSGSFNTNFIVYWKNGSVVRLTDEKTSVIVTGISVLRNDVYVSALENNSKHYIAKYWKNGQPVRLSDGSNDEITSGIVVLPE